MTATKGLEGIVATTSSISSIVDGVLTYRGYDIDDLADHATFEETAYLLWFGSLPTVPELEALRRDLSAYAPIPEQVLTQNEAVSQGSQHHGRFALSRIESGAV
ncbi:citrate/2-methylcitrate synthase [Paenibacillus rhizoplanae]